MNTDYHHFSEKPASPSLLDKLERTESLNELWTDELADMDSFWELEFEFRLLLLLVDEAEDIGLAEEGASKLAGVWTSTLNLAVAVTLVTCWAVGVEHLEELPLALPCKINVAFLY